MSKTIKKYENYIYEYKTNNINIEEHDVIILTEELDDVPIGSIGAIVYISPDHKKYMVEFILNNNSIIKTLTVYQFKKKL